MTFRSEPMTHYQLIIPREIGWEVVNYLGKIELVHLDDVSNPNNRPFSSQVKRCEESLQKLSSIIAFMKSKHMGFEEYVPEVNPRFVNDLMRQWQDQFQAKKTNPNKRLNEVEDQINREWSTFLELTQRADRLNAGLNASRGRIAVYASAERILGDNYFTNSVTREMDAGSVSSLSYLAGLIKPEEVARITKMIFRVSRGYATVSIIQAASLGLPVLEGLDNDVIFVFFPTSEKNTLQKKLQRVIESLCTALIALPHTKNDFERDKGLLIKEYESSRELVRMINEQTHDFMTRIGSIGMLEQWRIFLTKQKVLYESLNKMQVRDQFMTARLYIPTSEIPKLGQITKMSPAPIFNELKAKKPPSKFQINTFTYPGQQIVETYGVPRYGQVNPGIFTAITFPFLFGVMFGDIAHGFVLFCFGLFLVFFNNRLKTTGFKVMLSLRYLVLLMGFFACYCGFIYNDFLGISFNLFGSCYPMPREHSVEKLTVLHPKPGCTYPFGVDPAWERANNELQFINSLKMKIAVIIGVVHMTFGICLKAVNCIYFRKKLDFYFEFIPQVIFMILLFGYMDFLIIFKWLKYYPPSRNYEAPSIISTMINIPLKMGHSTTAIGGGNMWGESIDDTSQTLIQQVILVLAVLCIPTMLIPKPAIEIRQMKQHQLKEHHKKVNGSSSSHSDMAEALQQPVKEEEEEGEQHDSGEIIVHQIIETIEFVLGSISNTASYLRLWALSLAHSQLSQVFFDKTVGSGFEDGWASFPAFIYGFYFLAWITFGVLMCMDSMECFLHALRLHWVEFQNKFYKADGIKFTPLSFKAKVVEMKEHVSGKIES